MLIIIAMGTNRFRLGMEDIECKTVWVGTVKRPKLKNANDNSVNSDYALAA